MTNKLTVVVPVAKMSGRLQTLESWLRDVEQYKISVVIVHDDWNDNTGVELEQLLLQLNISNICIVHGTFHSAGLARNHGLLFCKTEWIAFWDADDLPNLDGFSTMVESGPSFNSNILVGHFSRQDVTMKESTRKIVWSHLTRVNQFHLGLNPGLWRIAFRYSFVKDLRFPSLEMGEDQIYLANAFSKAKQIDFENKWVYTYFTGVVGQATQDINKLNRVSDAFIQFPTKDVAGRNNHKAIRLLMLLRLFWASCHRNNSEISFLVKMLFQKFYSIIFLSEQEML